MCSCRFSIIYWWIFFFINNNYYVMGCWDFYLKINLKISWKLIIYRSKYIICIGFYFLLVLVVIVVCFWNYEG